MNRWKYAFKARFYWTIILIALGVIALLIKIKISDTTISDLVTCIGTSLISAGITIFLIKFDIMSELKNNYMDKYGIIGIEDGRNAIFKDNTKREFNYIDWKEFLKKSSDKTIDIVGISMYSFFYPNNLIDFIINLAKKKYVIRIFFANPLSNEVNLQSIEEEKEGKLKEHIELLSKEFIERISNHEKRDKINKYLEIYYCKTLPKAFIVRSGNKMIITPYLLKGPFKEPTIIAYNKNTGENSYYGTYYEYINKINKSAIRIGNQMPNINNQRIGC